MVSVSLQLLFNAATAIVFAYTSLLELTDVCPFNSAKVMLKCENKSNALKFQKQNEKICFLINFEKSLIQNLKYHYNQKSYI